MKDQFRKKKLTKTAKVTLPFFALFGGNGFATSRNPLTLQSSGKQPGKSVVYVHEVENVELPSLALNGTQKAKSPFVAFTTQSVQPTKSAQSSFQSKALAFLKHGSAQESCFII